MSETLSGTIEDITFHNPDNGFTVLRALAKGKKITVVGNLPRAVAGEYLEATGAWVQNRDHGLQFQAEEIRTTPPQTIEGIEKFLGSGLVKGIGPHFAKRIVEVFGERTLQVIDESPTFLKEIRGIGRVRIERIRESWKQQRAVREILVFLQSHGVGAGRAVRIYKTYGDKAVEIIRANPYRLATDIWGIGFKSADEIAEKMGIARDSPLRARASVQFLLKEQSDDGHCGYPEAILLDKAVELTGIARQTVVAAAEEGIRAGEMTRDPVDPLPPTPFPEPGKEEPWLYLKSLYHAEVGVARSLQLLCQGSHPLSAIDLDKALVWVEKKIGLELAPTQRDAIAQAVTQKVLVITGGPGVGKTTLVRGILEIFAAKKLKCGLAAPTGRAAKRLAETTGREAKTLHRLLEFDPAGGGFQRDLDRPLDFDLLVVDEASMVDVSLMNHLLKAVPPQACLVLVGDVDQLPSVGPGTVLADIIAAKAVPVVRLTEIFRQAEQSWIVRAAHQINHGELPQSAPAGQGDFYFVEAQTPADILDKMVTMIRERIPARFGLDPVNDIQVLTPMNRTELGTRNLNQKLQEVLNPKKQGPEVTKFGWTFRLGDKVLQTRNNYDKDVFNGDIGRVKAIDDQDQEVIVDYDGREVPYDFEEMDELILAYALTIHKSQGSEYLAVVIPLHNQHFLMLQRNLLYTGLTRGKKLVVLVGQGKALATAVRRQDTARRYTRLRERLQHG